MQTDRQTDEQKQTTSENLTNRRTEIEITSNNTVSLLKSLNQSTNQIILGKKPTRAKYRLIGAYSKH